MNIGVLNIYTRFTTYGGAQLVALTLHKHLDINGQRFIMGFNKYEKFNERYLKPLQNEYLRFSIRNIVKNKESIFISHHRRTTTYLILLSKILHLKLRIIHVAHNEFHSLKYFTFFPKKIVAVSNRVKDNLISYFNIDEGRITVIYNGIEDRYKEKANSYDGKKIKILYPARICPVKQQLLIVKTLTNYLDERISIDFAGDGEDKEELIKLCQRSKQFKYIGFVEIDDIIHQYDYVMLFSKKEGLPLALIEACMFQKPILANDVGGNLEILIDGYNGYQLSVINNLTDLLNRLVHINQGLYSQLSANSRKMFLYHFSIQIMVYKYYVASNVSIP